MLFLFPIILKYLPVNETSAGTNYLKEPSKIVYASNVFEEDLQTKETVNTEASALLYFTHNQEAYAPITKAVDGKVTVSHHTENITKFGDKLKGQLDSKGVQTTILPVDNTVVRNEKGMSFAQSYASIRPHVAEEVKTNPYDLIIDLHRDSIGKKYTTAVHEGTSYAKVAFVIGMEHANYQSNEEKAVSLQQQMEKIVPGITRNIIRKSGSGVDGKYNQDLHPNLIVVELGGVENTEEELNRTIAVLAEAIPMILAK